MESFLNKNIMYQFINSVNIIFNLVFIIIIVIIYSSILSWLMKNTQCTDLSEMFARGI